jgi:hypothetical protein
MTAVKSWPFRKYYHAFALMRAEPPFPIVYVGQDFRFADIFHDERDLVLVQFCSGMARKGAKTLLIAYGVADCEARVAKYNIEDILRPMAVSLKSLSAAETRLLGSRGASRCVSNV